MKEEFKPIKADAIKALAFQTNVDDKYMFEDLGPTTSLEELLVRPERPYLVDGVLTQGSLALLSSESFVGKTFFAMELARAVASGETFMGKYPVRRGGVLYIAQDGSDEEYLRQWRKVSSYQRAIHKADTALYETQWDPQDGERVHGSEPPHDPYRSRLSFYFNRALAINNSSDLEKLAYSALRLEHSEGEVYAPEFGEDGFESLEPGDPTQGATGVKLIVFDAGHSVFFGDENASGEVQNVMTNLRQLAIATEATILLLVHLNKYSPPRIGHRPPKVHENRVRGSGVFQSAPDWHMQLHRGDVEHEVHAFQLKDRAGNRCRSFIYKMDFTDRVSGDLSITQNATLCWIRDMTPDEHKSRAVNPSFSVVPGSPTPEDAIRDEFQVRGELTTPEVEAVLSGHPRWKDQAPTTVATAARDMLSDLVARKLIERTVAPAPRRPAKYRWVNAGGAAAGV